MSSLLLDVLLPSQILTHGNNTGQPTESESQTTTHTKKNNMDQLTGSEFQDNTTKKGTARGTTTQDATGKNLQEKKNLHQEKTQRMLRKKKLRQGVQSHLLLRWGNFKKEQNLKIFSFVFVLFSL